MCAGCLPKIVVIGVVCVCWLSAKDSCDWSGVCVLVVC